MLGDLEEGCCRELSRREVEALYKRCLPEDPLCPTVGEVQDTLSRRLRQTARRAHKVADISVLEANGSAPDDENGRRTGTCVLQGTGERLAVAGDDDASGTCGNAIRPGRDLGTGFAGAEDLAHIVRILIDFARRDLHETPAGPRGGSSGPDVCFGEEESLARARAVPPNESHMICGYRSSQIERLGLTYGSM